MGGKLSPIIIVVIILVVVALAALVFGILTGENGNVGDSEDTVEDIELETPILNLTKLDIEDDKTYTSVTIKAEASTDDPDGIEKIDLPNGESVKGSKAEYVATENGDYQFVAHGNNGMSEIMTITVSEIAKPSSNNPYIPEGFSVVEGAEDVEKGYVISDDYGNYYVWIPVEDGKAVRTTYLDNQYQEKETTASELSNSISKYYGFYVARYEASLFETNDGDDVAASIGGKIPWTGLTYAEAKEAAKKSASAFGYEGVTTAIMNSYAWDTMLDFIDTKVENYSSSTDYGNYSGTILPTGTSDNDLVFNIFDLAGNVREWTTEIYTDGTTSSSSSTTRVIRGGSATLNRTPKSRIGYDEKTSDPYWGFRTILYK